MFTDHSTLMWAVLTGQTDWVCHIRTLTLCVKAVAWSCIIVTWWSGSGSIQAWSLTTSWFPSVLWHCWFGHLACKNHLRNDVLCVVWKVKPYTLTVSIDRVIDQLHQLCRMLSVFQEIVAVSLPSLDWVTFIVSTAFTAVLLCLQVPVMNTCFIPHPSMTNCNRHFSG